MAEQKQKKFQEIKSFIEESEYIVLSGHENPDGDSLGSVLGLMSAILDNTSKDNSIFKKVTPYSKDPVPEYLQFLPLSEHITQEMSWYPDLVICTDYGEFERTRLPKEYLQGARIVSFDHHPFSGQIGDIKFINTNYSSASEMIYDFLISINWYISQRTALNLLTGIITDTEAFSHNTFPRTLRAAGTLTAKGADIRHIYTKAFTKKNSENLKIWGKALQNLYIDEEKGYSIIYLPFKFFQKYGIVADDLKGLVSVMNLGKETKFCALVTESENGKIKGSLRSDQYKNVDVSRIAEKLGGGGHKYAAGFGMECSFEEAKERIEKTIEETLTHEVVT